MIVVGEGDGVERPRRPLPVPGVLVIVVGLLTVLAEEMDLFVPVEIPAETK